ncbi:hypothetical protein OUO_1424 [Helicobacter pylori R046Wa]|nr:hypothetical protein OUO_1424 [Helicobacter pylori R046Wa]
MFFAILKISTLIEKPELFLSSLALRNPITRLLNTASLLT